MASHDSGSDHPSNLLYRDTYFNSSYDPDPDLLITIPPDFSDDNYAHGRGKMDALLQTNLPNCHLPILLVNDIVFGGSDDGSNLTGIAATASGSSIFVIHECGHVLANLGDEYTSEFPGYPDTEEPNTTTQTNFDAIKWKAWINTNTTPIPTPETATYINDAGLFEGAHHHSDGWYRPQINCAMGNFSSPFCAVCSEALVLSFYRQVRPVDGFTPAATNLSLASPQMLTFTLKLVQPATDDLTVQWFTNGIYSVGATNQSFAVELGLGAGGVTNVSARVKDETPLVRTDSDYVLAQTVTWSVNAGALSPSFSFNIISLAINFEQQRNEATKFLASFVSWFLCCSFYFFTVGELAGCVPSCFAPSKM